MFCGPQMYTKKVKREMKRIINSIFCKNNHKRLFEYEYLYIFAEVTIQKKFYVFNNSLRSSAFYRSANRSDMGVS